MGSGAAIFATLTFAAGAWFAVVVVLAYATGWGWPGLMTAAVVGSDRSTAASSSSITQAGVFVGAGGGPLFLGLVVEYQSYDMMWWIVAGALTLSALLARSVGLRRDRIDGG